MKKIFVILAAVMMLGAASSYASSEVSVEFNSVLVEFDQPAVILENRTLVPLRKIFELLGAEVNWDNETRTASSKKGQREVSITIGSNELFVDGKAVELDVPARIINNRTLVPLRAISEAYDSKVEWSGEERCAKIYDNVYYEAPKKDYNSGNFNFSYFADCEIKKSEENVLSAKSGKCSVTITAEKSNDVTIDEEYLAYLRKGLEAFSSLSTKYVKKIPGKNIAEIGCYNKGNTIYYLFANKGGISYNLALTVPDSGERYDVERLMYILKSFAEKM